MSDILLTRDADKTLCIVYKEYLSRRKNGDSKDSSCIFKSSNLSTLFPNTNMHDVNSNLNELTENDLIKRWIDGSFTLNSNAIVYMENRFKNGVKEVTDFIAKFIP